MFLVNTDQSHLSQIWSYLDLLLHFQFLNKGAALVHVYTDGSVLVTHGGTELGQGLHTKMVQIWSILMQASCISVLQGTLYFIKLLQCSRCVSLKIQQLLSVLIHMSAKTQLYESIPCPARSYRRLANSLMYFSYGTRIFTTRNISMACKWW